MTNTAPWKTPLVLIEMLQRRDVYGQTYSQIEAAFSLTHAQVYPAIAKLTKVWSDDPRLHDVMEQRNQEVADKLLAELGEPPLLPPGPRGRGRPTTRPTPSPEQLRECDVSVLDCIHYVRIAAAQVGITPRKFLWLAITNPASA
jgi:hypothetical protein